jgi:hypothetical protein
MLWSLFIYIDAEQHSLYYPVKEFYHSGELDAKTIDSTRHNNPFGTCYILQVFLY